MSTVATSGLFATARGSDEVSLVNKRKLANSMLPGTVSAAAGFRATVAKPKAWETILRIIRDEQDDDAIEAAEARARYVAAIDNMVKRLHWKDFELLIDLVFAPTGQRLAFLF